ncbi:HAMP domain-containing histidine kinase [Desulfosporosinus metallidurans]|uniref:HAMP domain-containing histidine kinase n=1 Tax=Desulfosporosinus metallidurans TaxID=1888891 RepID=UPI00094C8880
MAVSLLAALALAIGLGIFYSLLFTRPLKAMNFTALEITRGNYSARTGVNRKDELGQLGNSLDHLTLKLGNTINQLFQEKGKLNDIISSISGGIVAFDTTLKPISVNTALAEIMNRPQPYLIEAVEKDLNNLEIEVQLTMVMEDKKPSQVFKDWLGKRLKFTVSPIVDNHGTVTGSVALVQDISESERLEQLRRDFVANVSHEFRTPLTVIRGSFEALVDGMVENSEDIRRYHHRILESKILENNTLSIIIRDQGYGIAADELPYIWDRFYKVDKSRQGLGTGLGLAIAKHLLELHDGKVFVQSEIGKGTEIEIKLFVRLYSL